jgi:predicted small lipoprotein YifL
MLRLPDAAARRTLIVAATAVALAGCGIKGPLVPARSAATPPPPATKAPEIPSATPPANPQPAP